MSGISFVGSYSGIDRATIDQLMAAERIPLNKLNSRKTDITSQQNAWKDINTRLNSLSEKLKALQDPASFTSMKASSSSDDTLTVSASRDAVAGKYEIEVNQLASSTRIIGGQVTGALVDGKVDINKALGIEDGKNFTITNADGESAEIDITSEDSLKSIVNKINAAKDIGIKATIIDGKIILTDEKSGDRDISLTGDNNGTLTILGLNASARDVDLGHKAELTINGISITSDSNTISDSVLGLNINLKDIGKSIVDVSLDTEKASEAIQEFVNQYNSTMSFIEEKMAIGTVTDDGPVGRGPLAGDSSLRSLHDSLRRMITDRQGNEGSSLSDISQIGVTTSDKSGVLSFNSSKFLEEFAKDAENVINFFSYKAEGENEGFVERLNSRIDSYISSSNGLIKNKTDSLDRALKELNRRIDSFNERMERREEYYIKTFTALDVAMMEAESQMSWLLSQVQGMNAQMGSNR